MKIEGLYRVSCGSPKVSVAGVAANVDSIIKLMEHANCEQADCLVLPEMCLTAYTCADLFHNRLLLDAAIDGLDHIIKASAEYPTLLVSVGLPVESAGRVYNCAAFIANGSLLALIPKTYIPNYNEFYEKRWFAPAPEDISTVRILGKEVPFGTGILIDHGGIKLAAEICEDLWTPVPPSCKASLAGAEVILNLSASDDLIGKYAYLTNLIAQQSARCICAYAYASAGFGESSTDLVFDGKLFIAENGNILAKNTRWQAGPTMISADIDIEAIRRDRIHNSSFGSCADKNADDFITIYTPRNNGQKKNVLRHIDRHPFVPSDSEVLASRCEEIINIQVAGLAKRLEATSCHCLVVGVSGGLDSTLALLIAARAFDRLGLDRKGIVGVTMPGFGTTSRTHTNALGLMEALGISIREISIVPSVNQHFSDIGHNPEVQDVTYENCQARERTQILMDLSNELGGMVLGTGDLSELALGWATYNGDHMSMYGVNSGIPKTLVKYLTQYFATITPNSEERECLLSIVDTPISPELIPAAADGSIKQKTEDLVGPYELHDFFLYHMLRYGFTPARIFAMGCHAFEGEYSRETILRWEREFFRRFFQQQFKRSCLPDGPKVGSVCLSPRGDWRMPSDATSALWLNELDSLK